MVFGINALLASHLTWPSLRRLHRCTAYGLMNTFLRVLEYKAACNHEDICRTIHLDLLTTSSSAFRYPFAIHIPTSHESPRSRSRSCRSHGHCKCFIPRRCLHCLKYSGRSACQRYSPRHQSDPVRCYRKCCLQCFHWYGRHGRSKFWHHLQLLQRYHHLYSYRQKR